VSTTETVQEHFIEQTTTAEDAPQVASSAVLLEVHPRRAELYEELHNRPSPLVETPCCVSHIAIMVGEDQRQAEYQHLVELCQRFSIHPPVPGASCFYQNFGGFELRWESHMEFSTYTFIRTGVDTSQFDGNLFTDSALTYTPRDWLQKLPGQSLAAVHLTIVCGEEVAAESLQRSFECMRLSGSQVASGKADVYTSFRIHSDGFSRILINDRNLNPYQAGRLMQRVLEIETYRLMALLALPTARKLAPQVREMEEQLAGINQRIAALGEDADDNAMLAELSGLAAQIEQFRSDTNYRFGATKAYYDIVNSRLRQLKEVHIPGLQAWQEFIDRRLGPGIKTCDAIKGRMEDLSRRISQTSSLLRTRVELSIESQNQELLSSMNRRSGLQLRLQQTVEGLSVAAIAYYLMGLLEYVYDALIERGITLDKATALGISVPLVMGITWWATYKVLRVVKSEAK